MATYKYYNIQMLPLTNSKKNIGKEGYIKLFQHLGDKLRKVLSSEGDLRNIAVPLRNDFFFAPYEINAREDMVYGRFLKFDKVDVVRKLLAEFRLMRLVLASLVRFMSIGLYLILYCISLLSKIALHYLAQVFYIRCLMRCLKMRAGNYIHPFA